MQAQKGLHHRFNKKARTSPPEIEDNDVIYYCGFVAQNAKLREEMIDQGNHYGVWQSGSQRLLVVPYYAEREKTLAGMRFWMCPPGNVDGRIELFRQLLKESRPIPTYGKRHGGWGRAV